MSLLQSKSIELKQSVVTIYETATFNSFLKDGLHPGGIDLTKRILDILDVNKSSRVLELGCGRGRTAMLIKEKKDCNVIGIDLSVKMIVSACLDSQVKRMDNKIDYILADSELIPFHEGIFDTIISECSFSVLPDKKKAASEIIRVLKPGGEFILTDIMLQGEKSIELQNQLTRTIDGPSYLIPSIYGALSLEGYISLFQEAGFIAPYYEDHSIEMKRLAFKMGTKFGNWQCFLQDLSSEVENNKHIKENNNCLNAYKGLFSKGRLGYALIKVKKPQ